ncbi:pentapeptide repeat-containing protein [Szabonella alba]|uniref:Pentapeptide repeat-containing protein n=1 Tax=Szabonella alba TaxID=2804194 RepID=A0A8K0V7G1_9RHOB|nr:pentapeptide repeat-containing protein [Szabonella alba]MBL4917139.1 pentapeptide repeat-containing protein [Szabonella alba]
MAGWLTALAWVLGAAWLWLLAGTLLALWQVFNRVEDSPLTTGSLGLGALIAAFLGAPFVIYGTWLKHHTNRLEQEGHMTDRITKAVEQLGAEKVEKVYTMDESGKPVPAERTVPNIEVRIGAILSLERIAQDSTTHDKGRDHVRVMEILCAYIRENSNARKPVDHDFGEWEPLKYDPTEKERAEHIRKRQDRFGDKFNDGKARQWAQTLPKPRADVQLALTVIGRRSADQRRVEATWPAPPTKDTIWPFDTDFKRPPDEPGDTPLGAAALDTFRAGVETWGESLRNYRGYRLDLRGANLQGADMAAKQPDGSDAVFSGAFLTRARLDGANLRGVRMEGASLSQARMEGANLAFSRLEKANLTRARMEGADLGNARMERANLWEARMEGAHLGEARMEGADLDQARMEGANLWGARMKGAFLFEARMEGARLGEARMEGAFLLWAQMDQNTSLNATTLRGAALKDVDYRAVAISEAQVNSTFGDASVKLPEGIPRPDHWPDWQLPADYEPAYETEWQKWQSDPDAYHPPPKPNPDP